MIISHLQIDEFDKVSLNLLGMENMKTFVKPATELLSLRSRWDSKLSCGRLLVSQPIEIPHELLLEFCEEMLPFFNSRADFEEE